ncbi:MAG: hypothetical protein IT287_01575 [Bdellovibrionaceae bacterium]|nr:hypothetical protein [Pseudobdellovibrionaceae bacterium]
MKKLVLIAVAVFSSQLASAFSIDLNKHIICTSSVVGETMVFKINDATIFKNDQNAKAETSEGYNGEALFSKEVVVDHNLDTNVMTLSTVLKFEFRSDKSRYLLTINDKLTGMLFKGDKKLKSFKGMSPTDTAVVCGID